MTEDDVDAIWRKLGLALFWSLVAIVADVLLLTLGAVSAPPERQSLVVAHADVWQVMWSMTRFVLSLVGFGGAVLVFFVWAGLVLWIWCKD
jgi:hypothetical protein